MRSEFLTVLCVMTFLSCAIGLFDSVVSFTQNGVVSQARGIERSGQEEATGKDAPKLSLDDRSADGPGPSDPDIVRKLAIGQFGYSLLTLIGAGLMFNRRRIGFWVYAAGVATGLLVPIVLVGFQALNATFGVFFSLIFIGLYWLNLKEMR